MSVANRKSGQDRTGSLSSDKRDDGSVGVAVDDGDGRAAGTGDGDGFADEINIFYVRAGSNEHGIAVVGGVDGRLDGRLIGRDVNRLLCEKNRRKNE